MSESSKRPEGLTDEMLEYLDMLRESAVTNMFGAAPYLQDEFGMTHPGGAVGKKMAEATLD